MPNYPEHKYPNRKKVTDPRERSRLGNAARGKTIEQRMAERTDKDGPGGCHMWTGAITWQGYGQLWWNGKMYRAHQVAWMLAGNEKPVEPMVLHHTCETPLCVNPAHLKAVTRYENAVLLSRSVWGQNKRKTHCKHGHPFEGTNLALYTRKDGSTGRVCLTCQPSYWRYAVIPRKPPPGARLTKAEIELLNQGNG